MALIEPVPASWTTRTGAWRRPSSARYGGDEPGASIRQPSIRNRSVEAPASIRTICGPDAPLITATRTSALSREGDVVMSTARSRSAIRSMAARMPILPLLPTAVASLPRRAGTPRQSHAPRATACAATQGPVNEASDRTPRSRLALPDVTGVHARRAQFTERCLSPLKRRAVAPSRSRPAPPHGWPFQLTDMCGVWFAPSLSSATAPLLVSTHLPAEVSLRLIRWFLNNYGIAKFQLTYVTRCRCTTKGMARWRACCGFNSLT